MSDSLHTSISLHKFKYVGKAHCIETYDFHYMFKQYIEIYRNNKQLREIEDINFIDKININNFLYKVIQVEDILISKQPKDISSIDIENIDIRVNEFIFHMKIVNHMEKLKGSYKDLFNEHNEILRISEPKDLKHQDRNVMPINKSLVSKLTADIGLNPFFKADLNRKILARELFEMDKQNKEKIILTNIINNFIIDNACEKKDLNKDIILKEMDYKTYNIGINNTIYKSIDKHDIDSKFTYEFLNEIGKIQDYSLSLNKVSMKNILKYGFNLFGMDESWLDMRRNKNNFRFMSNTYSNISKLNYKTKFLVDDLKYVNKIIPKKYHMGKPHKDIQIIDFSNTFLQKSYEHIQVKQVNDYITFLRNGFGDIDVINLGLFLNDTKKEIYINNQLNFFKKAYENIRLYNNFGLAKVNSKSKIMKLDSIKFAKKYKSEILKSDLQWLQDTYKNIYVNDSFQLCDKFAIHDINKMFIEHMLDKVFKDIDILNPSAMIDDAHVDIDISNSVKNMSLTNKVINKAENFKNVERSNIHDIDTFIDDEKLLNRMDIKDIGIIEGIIKGFEIDRSWWIIEHNSDITDRIIIPNIDYPYEKEPIMGVDKHPISSLEEIAYEDVNYGNEEIYISIKIMQQMLNIFFMMWHIVKEHYLTLSPKEAIEKTMYVFYYWLNIKEVKSKMIEKKSREDYLRIYRWFRWEAERVWIKVKDDNINTGLKSIGMLLSEIILYMKNHHYDIVPLTNKNSLIIVDDMLEVFKLKVPDYFRIPIDKNKGKRKYKIESNKKDKFQNFTKKNN